MLNEAQKLTQLIERRFAYPTLALAPLGFAGKFPQAEAIQLVRDLRQEEFRQGVQIAEAAPWLARLDA